MPQFDYTGYKPDGSGASGTIEADGLQDAAATVRTLGIYPREIRTHEEKTAWKVKSNDAVLLPAVTRQLSTLIAAGVPLLEALKSLSDENTGFWKGMLINIREHIAGGASFSRALEAEKKIFPEFYVHMVAAGEQSGRLGSVLDNLAIFLEKQDAMKSKIRTAMIYPLFMSGIGFVVLSFLFMFVLPKIVRIFENTKSALPLITRILIAISWVFVNYWWLLLMLAAGLFFGFRKFREKNPYAIDRIKLRLPGGLLQSLYFGRFARTTGFLVSGGLPLLRSLELSAKAVGNKVLQDRIMAAASMVAEGSRLSAALSGFPSVLLQLIATGEKSGTLAEVLGRAAESYEADFERRVQKALSLLEPAMILLMGLIVGFIVLAVLLPMFQLNQLVK
ncbi:MAG: type II secretion system F family protein [Nitrospiraceae bacterium]|nr:type II secretion system F family protein [Nitrospiraceae bacterium]